MKKSLLATTALAALGAVAVAGPAVAAEKIKVSVGGYMEQWFGFADNKNNVAPNTDGFDQQSDGEIHFKGSTTLDNGIKVGINGDPPNLAYPMQVCGPDEGAPSPIDTEGRLPYVEFPLDSIVSVTIELTYDDGEVATETFNRADIEIP